MTTITNGKTLRVDHAEIKTATVTIRALTVDRRQVTLALFRQLLEEPVVHYGTGEFRGLPWGTVNYCPDKKACDGIRPYGTPHLHIVWQKDGELRRAVETPPGRFDPYSEYADEWLLLALDDGWRPKDWDLQRVRVLFQDIDIGIDCAMPYTEDLRRGYIALFQLRGETHDYSWDEERQALAAEQLAALKAKTTREAAKAQVQSDLLGQKAAHEKRGERWRELTELDQLFIAT